MKKYFEVDYDYAVLNLYYGDEKFTFDLKEGDVGDYWNSFTTKDGVLRDINYYQDAPEYEPTLSTYGVVDNQINTSDEEPIDLMGTKGNVLAYFNLP
jgi:hypothetical protein